MAWTRGSTIGRGSSATVSLAKMVSGEVFAVKSSDITCSASLQKEQSFLSQLSSPYIIKYISSDITCESENTKIMYNVFMEYMPDGTLADLIKNQKGSLDESLIQLYAYQILMGLNYLHSDGIVHCDIKSQNLLIGENGIKIADLGCAKTIGNSDRISGTPIYMAPEVARGEEQGFAADIWSLGCTIIEMATGYAPWSDMIDPVSAMYRIGYSDYVMEFPDWLSNNCKNFLSKCLIKNAADRWTAAQLLDHPFFEGTVEDNQIEFLRNSPVSVLEQSIWDSLELSESESSMSQVSFDNVVSPKDRIKKLAFSSDSKISDWTKDESWLSVRGIDNEENPNVLDAELSLILVSEEGIMEMLVIFYDLLLSQNFDEINVNVRFADVISDVTCSFKSVEDNYTRSDPRRCKGERCTSRCIETVSFRSETVSLELE